jgi:hypothetical protein
VDLAGIVGGGAGLISRHRKVHGLKNISATYATNLAIVTGCYCGKLFLFSFFVSGLKLYRTFSDVIMLDYRSLYVFT